MLSRSQRLSVEQFNTVMEKGRITHSPLFLLRSLKDESIDRARISVVAPQKIVKTASARNRLRRQVYEAIQPLYEAIDARTNAAVFAKQLAVEADFVAMEQDIKELFVKAGLMK